LLGMIAEGPSTQFPDSDESVIPRGVLSVPPGVFRSSPSSSPYMAAALL